MNILALDTASEILSIALETEAGVFYTEADAGTRHSELLMECVDGLCKTAGFLPENLDIAACMKGPGSFTGLRIGFSAAKGLALALGIPLVSVSTLDCLAYPFSVWPGIVLPVLDAKKGCFFAALYRGDAAEETRPGPDQSSAYSPPARLTDYMDASPETLAGEIAKHANSPNEPVLLTGTGAELLYSRLAFRKHIRIDPGFRRGKAKELLFFAKQGTLDKTDGKDAGPDYLRKSEAELN